MKLKVMIILIALTAFNGFTSCTPQEILEETNINATGDEVDDPAEPDEDN